MLFSVALNSWPGDEPNITYFGLALKTWGRTGKIFQYIGGLTALIDILGSDRIEAARKTLLDRVTPKPGKGVLANFKDRWIIDVPIAVGGLTFATVMIIDDNPFKGVHVPYTFPYILIVIGGTILGSLTWIVVGMFISLFVVFLVLFPVIIVAARAAAWLARSDANLKLIGFIVLSVGFAMDFMAS